MPSFDIVSKLNLQEVDNAIHQATKEVIQRYDLKDSKSTIVRADKKITLDSSDDFKLKAVYDILQSKLVKRGVSLKAIKEGKVEPSAGGRARQVLDFIDGIDSDKSRELVKTIKDSKIKVQAAYQDEQVRVSGKKRDDLQEVIGLLRAKDFPIPLQFINFRD